MQYPFGYGLSYTTFDWQVKSAQPQSGSVLEKDGKITIEVEVTNTGKVAGQDVAELYYNPPYRKGGIEKASANLCAYAKTKVLKPGEQETLTLAFAVEDMKSYDYDDANENGFMGYELEAGDYEIKIGRNSHETVDTIPYKVMEDIRYEIDSATGAKVENRFTGTDTTDGVAIDGNSDGSASITYLSRNDFKGTFPHSLTKAREATQAIKELNLYTEEMAEAFIREDDPEVKTEQPCDLVIFADKKITEVGIELGLNPDDPRWETLLDHMTFDEMQTVVLHGYVHTREIPSIGKPETRDLDGPNQIGSFANESGTTGFNSVVIAQTWNASLAYRMGLVLGKEAASRGINGWYGPGINVHHSPFGGRNFEYYSEDAFLTGTMCSNAVLAAKNAGVYSYIKHLAVYESESNRDGLYTWLTEQALREIYIRPFEIAIKSGATGVMTSYGRIGAVWTGGSRALLTEVVRNEWGFNGAFITDYADHQIFMNGDQMVRAGGDLWMDGATNMSKFRFETASNTFKKELRRAAKDVTYMWLNALAVNAKYNEESDEIIQTTVAELNAPWWIAILVAVDVLAVTGGAVRAWFLLKKKKA